MDLAQLDTLEAQEAGIEVDIVHPSTGDPLGIKIRVAGIDSDRARKARNEITNRRIKKRRRFVSAAEVEEEELSLLAVMTMGWDGVELDGKPVELTVRNAAMIYKRFPWLRRQVDAEAGDVAAFLKS